MTQTLLVLAVALTVGAVVFGIAALLIGNRHGLQPAEPDDRALPLPADRPLIETDLAQVRFDTAIRGYRMAQVDAAIGRAAYDIGYKEELIRVLQAEIVALREGRFPDAEVLRRAREAAAAPPTPPAAPPAAPSPTPPPAPVPAADDNGASAAVPEAEAAGDAGEAGDTLRAGGVSDTDEAVSGDAAASGRR